MHMLDTILECLGIEINNHEPNENHAFLSAYTPPPPPTPPNQRYYDDKSDAIRNTHPQPTIEEQAADFTELLLTTPLALSTLTSFLECRFNDVNELFGTSWTWFLAETNLANIETALRTGAAISENVRDAVEKAMVEAEAVGFVREHPVFVTLLAMGVLVLMAPVVLECLGFAEGGILEGSWAAAWQSRYAGFVPKGSSFAFLQRLGMTWGRW